MSIHLFVVPWGLMLGGFFLLQVVAQQSKKFKLSSSVFEEGKAIPAEYANLGVAGAKNTSPPISWADAPDDTRSFALACIDRHPIANNWIHWLVINISSTTIALSEGSSGTQSLPSGARELQNSFGTIGWGGPQPPPRSGTHRYEFIVYTLNVEKLTLDTTASLSDFNRAIEGKVLGTAKLIGTYEG